MSKFHVEYIEIKRKQLKKLPPEQLSFFVFAGHIINEFVFLQKLAMACQNRGNRLLKQKRRDKRWQAQLDGNVTQTLIVQRIQLGKIYEAKMFLELYAFKKPWFKALTKSLRPEGKALLKKLKNAHARDKKQKDKNPFYIGRNKFGFHYHIPPVLNLLAKDEHLPKVFRFFLTEHIGSALHQGNEETVTSAYLSMIALKRKSAKAGIGRTYDLLLSRQRLIQNLLAECISALIFPMNEIESIKLKNRTIVMSEKYDIHSFEIPWFLPKA